MDSSSSQTAARSWCGIGGCYFLIKGGNFPEKAVAWTQQTVSLTGVRDKQVYMIGQFLWHSHGNFYENLVHMIKQFQLGAL